MLISGQLPLSSVSQVCRVLRHNLSAGLTLHKVFRQQAERGTLDFRPIAARISDRLGQGESLEDALEPETAFPPLFVSLAVVGERTGNLPEIMGELEKYFALIQKLKRQFQQQITWPVLQLFAAIFVIAGMIYILGILSTGPKPFDPLGFGLTGTSGALAWLMFCFGSLGTVFAAYLILKHIFHQQGLVDEVLLKVPVLGPTLEAFALMRFCIALHLTLESGMGMPVALRLSLRGTGNGAFEAATPRVLQAIRDGEDLTIALNKANVFPSNFLDIIAVGEEGGRLDEVLKHQAQYYEEESSRRMTMLTSVASHGIWLLVALMIIFLIFRIASTIFGIYDSFGL